jgi:hypothetical protein
VLARTRALLGRKSHAAAAMGIETRFFIAAMQFS